MTIRTILFSILFLGNYFAYSQNTKHLSENTMLWKIEGNGLNTQSYMYGTIHIVCEKNIHISDTIKNVLLSTTEFFLEHPLLLSAEDSIENVIFLKGRTLKRLVGNFYFKRIKKILQNKYTLDEDKLNSLTPFIVELMITNALINCKTNSHDDFLKQISFANSIKINFLESTSEVNSTVNKISLQTQVDRLTRMLDNSNKVVEDIENDQYLYDKKDLISLFKKTAYTPDGKETYSKKILLDERNKNWLPIIENSIKLHSCFFAFGCAHLVGKDGIIALLLQKGYKVTPINY